MHLRVCSLTGNCASVLYVSMQNNIGLIIVQQFILLDF